MENASPSSVTLIFYRLGPVTKEPLLNIVAAALQGSSLCHCEIAIGESLAADGSMINVARVFNDPIGVELTARTGRSPQYCYVQLGSTERAVARMLAFARKQIGKPFSQVGMARSIVYPRTSDQTSWFCAELTAAILQVGGLLHSNSNPGAATPSSLYSMYTPRAAVAANPFKIHLLTERQRQSGSADEREPLLELHLRGAFGTQFNPSSSRGCPVVSPRNSRRHFRQLASTPARNVKPSLTISGLTLNSLITSNNRR